MKGCRSFRKDVASAFFFILLLPFFLVMLSPVEASAEGFDSIQVAFQKKPRFIAGFATKTTFIGGFSSPIFTVRAGVDFNNRIRMGMGLSWLKLPVYEAGRDNAPFYLDKSFIESSASYTVHPALQFTYVGFFLEYVYFRSKRWQFSIPIQFGVGDSRYKYNFNGVDVIENRQAFFLYEPAVAGQYKIMKWFGVGMDVGYRFTLINNKKIGSTFNSPVYDIKVIIFWGELFNMMFKPNEPKSISEK